MHHGIKHLIFLIILNSNLSAMNPPDLREQLRVAVRDWRTSEALELIAQGAPVNLRPTKFIYSSPELKIVAVGDIELSVLQLAAKHGDHVLVRALIQAGASLVVVKIPYNLKFERTEEVSEVLQEKTALIYAAESGSLACVQELLAAKADVHARDRTGNNALICAVRRGKCLDSVRALIAGRSDINCYATNGDTALLLAIRQKNETYVQELIAAKAEVNKKQLDDVAGDTPLVCAAKHGSPICMRMLIDAKADVNKCADYGQPPLMEATGHGDPICVEMLIAAGARPLTKNNNKDSALVYAIAQGNIPICDLLVEALLKVPNKKENVSIVTFLGLMRRKVKMGQSEVYRNRELFFREAFCRIIETNNRDNFAQSVVGKQLKEIQSRPNMPYDQYATVADMILKKYDTRANKSPSKCTVQ